MGLFDGFEAGWNSFKNNELKTITDVAFSPSPIVKAITNPQKAIEDPASLLPVSLGNNGPVVKDLDTQWKEVGGDYVDRVKKNADILISPNPIISAVTGNSDDILNFDKSAGEKWDNVTETVNDKVVQPVNETIIQPVIKETEKITETVKETVTNVTKGVSDALPIIAIGGAAVLVVSLLLGRR